MRPVILKIHSAIVYWPSSRSHTNWLRYKSLGEIVGLCGPFLTLRERTVSFVHQSALEPNVPYLRTDFLKLTVDTVQNICLTQAL